MTIQVQPIQHEGWTPLPFEGCRNVAVKMLMKLDRLGLSMLRLDANGTIHEHPAEIEIDVICLEGEGMVSLDSEQAPFRAGQRIHWPIGIRHRLWTENSSMVTLMVEHYRSAHPPE